MTKQQRNKEIPINFGIPFEEDEEDYGGYRGDGASDSENLCERQVRNEATTNHNTAINSGY